MDRTKLVRRLGTGHALPVEVVAFGWTTHFTVIRALGGEPALRTTGDSTPYRTDEGHYIIDARFPEGIADPGLVVRALGARSGIVETGLFLGLSPDVIVGGDR